MRLYKLDSQGAKRFSDLKTENLNLFVDSHESAALRRVILDTLSNKKKAQMVWVEEKDSDSSDTFIVYFGDSVHIDAFLSGPFHKESDKYTVSWIAIEPTQFQDSMRALKGYKCNEDQLAQTFPQYRNAETSSQSSAEKSRTTLKTPSTLSAKKRNQKKKKNRSESALQRDNADAKDLPQAMKRDHAPKDSETSDIHNKPLKTKTSDIDATKKVKFAANAGVTLHGSGKVQSDNTIRDSNANTQQRSKQQETEPLIDKGQASKSACCLLL